MGLVRIFRNGILSFLNNNHEYISKDMIPFSISEKLSSLHSHITYTAAKNFEGILNDLSIDTDIEIEYFNIYSSIETKRKGIENINTKNIEENRFIEDGIILGEYIFYPLPGISFILRITKSWTDFESLNFFNSLENKIQEEKKKLSLELANEDSKLMNSLKLTINKINNFEKVKLVKMTQTESPCVLLTR
ncbi:hypothetical protein HZS_7275 [Henneguya salminicola]|nr:hypothetical protein HZS_7275 [Henneguya salminicola]